jgi:hypothetical protein
MLAKEEADPVDKGGFIDFVEDLLEPQPFPLPL